MEDLKIKGIRQNPMMILIKKKTWKEGKEVKIIFIKIRIIKCWYR